MARAGGDAEILWESDTLPVETGSARVTLKPGTHVLRAISPGTGKSTETTFVVIEM